MERGETTPDKSLTVDPRLLFDLEFDKLIQTVDDAVTALDPLEKEVLQMRVLGDKVTIGGTFTSLLLSDLLTFRDANKIVYPPAKIVTLEELNLTT